MEGPIQKSVLINISGVLFISARYPRDTALRVQRSVHQVNSTSYKRKLVALANIGPIQTLTRTIQDSASQYGNDAFVYLIKTLNRHVTIKQSKRTKVVCNLQ